MYWWCLRSEDRPSVFDIFAFWVVGPRFITRCVVQMCLMYFALFLYICIAAVGVLGVGRSLGVGEHNNCIVCCVTAQCVHGILVRWCKGWPDWPVQGPPPSFRSWTWSWYLIIIMTIMLMNISTASWSTWSSASLSSVPVLWSSRLSANLRELLCLPPRTYLQLI